MKYTYKRECIISDKGDVVHITLLTIWICATIAVFLTDAYLVFIRGGDGIGSPVVGGLFAIATGAIGVSVYRDIRKRRKPALEIRRKAMTEGTRYSGTIVNAGMGKESIPYEWQRDDNTTETRYMNEKSYWIDVRYTDPQSGEERLFRALQLNKGMGRFIGCGVDVYVFFEWSPYLQKYLTLTYVDTGSL